MFGKYFKKVIGRDQETVKEFNIPAATLAKYDMVKQNRFSKFQLLKELEGAKEVQRRNRNEDRVQEYEKFIDYVQKTL